MRGGRLGRRVARREGAQGRALRAQEAGIPADSAAYALLDAWLKRRPEPYLLAAWTTLVQGMSESLPEAEVKKLDAALMERVRRVAGASGGVLGLGSKVSKQEAAVLQKLSKAFERPLE